MVLSATTNWILRQGLGKVASISFAYKSGSLMGADSKRYRLLADIVNDLALSINLLSPFLSPTIRPYVYACSSVCWAIVGIAGSEWAFFLLELIFYLFFFKFIWSYPCISVPVRHWQFTKLEPIMPPMFRQKIKVKRHWWNWLAWVWVILLSAWSAMSQNLFWRYLRFSLHFIFSVTIMVRFIIFNFNKALFQSRQIRDTINTESNPRSTLTQTL